MSHVENMVCALCYASHGNEHKDGCPKNYVGSNPDVYEHGYLEGAAQRLEVGALFSKELEGCLGLLCREGVLDTGREELVRLTLRGLLP